MLCFPITLCLGRASQLKLRILDRRRSPQSMVPPPCWGSPGAGGGGGGGGGSGGGGGGGAGGFAACIFECLRRLREP